MIEIFHVSDFHFGMSDGNDRKARHLLEGIRRLFPFKGYDNRYLLVTGDITNTGADREYNLALKALEPFKPRLLLTPGNHDWGSCSGMGYSEHSAHHFDHPFADTLEFHHPFFNKEVFKSILEDRANHTSLILIGLNSCTKKGLEDAAQGEIGEKQRKELDHILTDCDGESLKILFLHHIPNKDAEYACVMTLKDWKKLMKVVTDRVDGLAFGHQGKMDAGIEGPPSLNAPARAMQKRYQKIGTKRIHVLDANNSVPEQKFYHISLDGGQLSVEVVSAK